MNRRRFDKRSYIQSVLVPHDWSMNEAISWVLKHGYVAKKVDTTDNYHRFRQMEPRQGSFYSTISLPNGVKLIRMKSYAAINK